MSHPFSAGKPLTMNGLHSERVRRAFGAGIVIAIALGAHSAQQAVFLDQQLEGS